jgi:hypothetical protein
VKILDPNGPQIAVVQPMARPYTHMITQLLMDNSFDRKSEIPEKSRKLDKITDHACH